jgi:NADPH:quinone reductase
MKAVLCKAWGPPETLTVADIADPEPGPAEVVVAVKAAGLNFLDTLIIEGKYQYKPDLPFSPGAEVAGVVSALGRHVRDLPRATGSWPILPGAAAARRSWWRPTAWCRCPAAIGFEAAAGLTVTYGTTIHALRDRDPIKDRARRWWCWGRPAASARRPSRSARSWARG